MPNLRTRGWQACLPFCLFVKFRLRNIHNQFNKVVTDPVVFTWRLWDEGFRLLQNTRQTVVLDCISCGQKQNHQTKKTSFSPTVLVEAFSAHRKVIICNLRKSQIPSASFLQGGLYHSALKLTKCQRNRETSELFPPQNNPIPLVSDLRDSSD